MVEMSLQEAQLFRMLSGFFGRDRVVWNMSIRAVCGGALPASLGSAVVTPTETWVDAAGCLFTVVDAEDTPKMVVEFAPDFSRYIEVPLMERHQRLPSLLEGHGIRYISITFEEFRDMTDPQSSLDLVSFLKDKFGINESGDSDSSEG
jgi:hypothetical protein